MNRCATCKHWGEPWTPFEESPDDEDSIAKIFPVRRCEAFGELWDATDWNDALDRREVVPKYAHVLAFFSGDSGLGADVYTKAEFGCVMHEPRAEYMVGQASGNEVTARCVICGEEPKTRYYRDAGRAWVITSCNKCGSGSLAPARFSSQEEALSLLGDADSVSGSQTGSHGNNTSDKD